MQLRGYLDPGSRAFQALGRDDSEGAADDAAKLVIAGLGPAISLRLAVPCLPKRDGRDKPGHDDSVQAENALAPAALAPEPGPVVQPFADFALEAAVGRIVERLAAQRLGKIVLARERVRRVVVVGVA
jgi:hypothetical protein